MNVFQGRGVLFVMEGIGSIVRVTRTGIDNFMGGSIILYLLRPNFYL